jgi:hypothetical protein
VWEAGGKGVFAMPLAPDEIEKEELDDYFPVRDLIYFLMLFLMQYHN